MASGRALVGRPRSDVRSVFQALTRQPDALSVDANATGLDYRHVSHLLAVLEGIDKVRASDDHPTR
jgi:hypothetical protein